LSRRNALLRLAAIALLFVAAFALFATAGVSAADVRDHVKELGPAGPLLFIPISAALTVVFFPGPLLAGASGLLFGVALGTPISIVSATVGAVVAFSLSRWWAHDAVEHLAGERVNNAREWVGDRGFSSVFYSRLAPGAPYTVVNYAAGMTKIKLRDFTLATMIACSPRAFAYTALGGSLGNLNSPEAIAAVAVLVLMAVGGVIPIVRERRRKQGAEPAPETGL